MQDVPYQRWASYIFHTFDEAGIGTEDPVLEMAAGTGLLTEKIAPRYPNWIASDISREMVLQNRAAEKIQTDMENLPFADGVFSAAVTAHDSVNYLASLEKFSAHLSEVARILKPAGIYIFDVTTIRNVKQNFHNKEIREKYGNVELIWNNDYNPETRIIESELLFVTPDDVKRELHVQMVYTIKEIEILLRKHGLRIIRKDADYMRGNPAAFARLLVFVVQKKG